MKRVLQQVETIETKVRPLIPEKKEEFLKLKAPKSELEMSKMPCDVTFSLSNKKKQKDVEKS